MKVTVFFATDVHGSEVCWRKFINSGKHYEADVLILGGDMTGKAIVPIVNYGSGRYRFLMQDQRHDFEGAEELARNQRLIRDHGYYPVVTTDDEVQEFAQNPRSSTRCSRTRCASTIEEWVAWADERLSGTNIQCIVCPGNDDKFDIDEILATSKRIMVGEGNVIDLPEKYQLVSSGWTNLTPWDTPREEEETRFAPASRP